MKGHDNMETTKLSRFISLILRHNPMAIGIKLDANGWANTNELLKGMQDKGNKIDMALLEHIVDTDEKGRYSFNQDKTKIRANQGHSIKVDVQLKEVKPPSVLYHGTAEKSRDAILSKGILKMSRQYVHLSQDIETANIVGARHGIPVILEVSAERMYLDGAKFYISENNVWLTEYVDKKYINVVK